MTKVKGQLSFLTCCSQGTMKEVEMDVMQQACQHGCSWRLFTTECPSSFSCFIYDALILINNKLCHLLISNLKHLQMICLYLHGWAMKFDGSPSTCGIPGDGSSSGCLSVEVGWSPAKRREAAEEAGPWDISGILGIPLSFFPGFCQMCWIVKGM